jgi:hypothetical protein
MTWEDKVQHFRGERQHCYAEIILAAKAYIDANHAVHMNPCGWKSCHGPKEDPVWAEYYRLSDAYNKAYADLWMATEVEYGEEPLACAAWNWRFRKVLARKCCHYMKQDGHSKRAAAAMRELQEAETELMEACGLSEYYKAPQHYIEQAFPSLKK